MTTNLGLLSVSLAYLGLLFGIAYYADWRRAKGRSLINNPSIYALSMAVYCTGWTFYGSVGKAASDGFMFLPIYLGPTLFAFLCQDESPDKRFPNFENNFLPGILLNN